jgi:hypothetical protein
MNTYLKKLDIPSLPDDLNEYFTERSHSLVQNLQNAEHDVYGNFSQDENTLNYVDDEKKYISRFGEISWVNILGIYDTPERKKLWSFIDNQEPWFREYIFSIGYQFLGPGTHVPPHIDPVKIRKYGILYVLDTGGDNVITKWYKPKNELNHLPVEDCKWIDYNNIECVYEHKLEPFTWYMGNFSEIHSIENLERFRTTLSAAIRPEKNITM